MVGFGRPVRWCSSPTLVTRCRLSSAKRASARCTDWTGGKDGMTPRYPRSACLSPRTAKVLGGREYHLADLLVGVHERVRLGDRGQRKGGTDSTRMRPSSSSGQT